MKYNPQIHNRQSLRLKGHDYGSEGLYFITICTYDRNHYFGEIKNGEMILNAAGKIAVECWGNIPNHFPHTKLYEYVIMPNHVHGIIEITENARLAGMDGDVRSKNFSTLQSPSKTIGSIVRGFKIGVTKWMRQNTEIKNVWHRNYYDHIIRNDSDYYRIAEYIIKNPKKWKEDKFYNLEEK